MKFKLTTFALLAMFGCHAQANNDMADLYKDSRIMTNILETSLKQYNRRDNIQIRDVQTSYLQGQGIVFEVRTNTGGYHFDMNFDGLISDLSNFDVVVPVAPVPPTPHVDGEILDISGDFEQLARDAMALARDALSENRDRRRELREQERDINWEKREYERRIRDLEFEMRHAEEERKQELESELKESRQEVAKLENKRSELEKMAEALKKEEKEARQKRKDKQEQKVKRFLADFEANIADTLCSYGAGLRALPEGEKINFVLPNFGQKRSGRGNDKMDKVYIFNFSDVKDCVSEKIDANELLGKAQTYLF